MKLQLHRNDDPLLFRLVPHFCLFNILYTNTHSLPRGAPSQFDSLKIYKIYLSGALQLFIPFRYHTFACIRSFGVPTSIWMPSIFLQRTFFPPSIITFTESVSGSLYAGTGSPKATLGSASFTGDEVSLTSENTNLQGTYINTETRQDVTTTGKKTQASKLNYDLMSTGWTLEGLGVINYSETYTYDDGLGHVTNEITGYGDHYIQGAADTGADYVYMEQYLDNQNGLLDTFQQSVAYNNGECLLTDNDLHVDGSVVGYQRAGSDPTQVYSTQDLTISGDLIDNTYAFVIYSSLDYSMTGIKVQGAESVYVGTVARASNNIGGADDDPYHRTGATSDMIGYANSAEGWSCGRYLDQYSADAYGAWDTYGYGDLSLGAKTVKSAVADMELTTDSDQQFPLTHSLWTFSLAY